MFLAMDEAVAKVVISARYANLSFVFDSWSLLLQMTCLLQKILKCCLKQSWHCVQHYVLATFFLRRCGQWLHFSNDDFFSKQIFDAPVLPVYTVHISIVS